jgi:hypothetical protein
MNSSGITFTGDGSAVNVGALIATTAGDVNLDENGKYNFTDFGDAAIINQGSITVSNGGFAILAAPYVENTGIITADGGRVELASTNNLLVDARVVGSEGVDFRGDDLISYSSATIDSALSDLGVNNTGTLQAQSGYIKISAQSAAGAINSVINLDGIADVDALDGSDYRGNVRVQSDGDINFTGTINANSDTAVVDDNYGDVVLDGKNVHVSGEVNISSTDGNKPMFSVISDSDIKIRNGNAPADAEINPDESFIYEGSVENISANANVKLHSHGHIDNEDALVGGNVVLEDLADNNLLGANGIALIGADSVSFADKNDTLTAAKGSILIEAGLGGIDFN